MLSKKLTVKNLGHTIKALTRDGTNPIVSKDKTLAALVMYNNVDLTEFYKPETSNQLHIDWEVTETGKIVAASISGAVTTLILVEEK